MKVLQIILHIVTIALILNVLAYGRISYTGFMVKDTPQGRIYTPPDPDLERKI